MSENVAKDAVPEMDENILIKSYNSSIKLKKEQLAQRIALATNSRECDNDNASSIEVNQSSTTDPENLMEADSGEFKVGDYARATYDDGVDYEATILSINKEEGTCQLRYIGYDNEQEVRLSDLITSWGKKSRRMQYIQAKQSEKVESEEAGTSAAAADSNKKQRADSASSGLGQKRKKSKKTSSAQAATFGNYLNFPAMSQRIPQPPVPPMMLRGSNDDDTEHLAAMLMSWYISGYYTGLYQGMQKSKAPQKSKAKSKK